MFQAFTPYGSVHAAAVLLPSLAGLLLTVLALRRPRFQPIFATAYAVLILAVRYARYALDISLGTFHAAQLLSVQICHVNLFLLVICLLRPRRGLFTFSFLAGIPTALAVVLFPGTVHRPPATARAGLFIASHMLLVTGALFLQAVHRFRIGLKTVLILHALPLVVIPPLFLINSLVGGNALYLMGGNPGTVLATMYEALGAFWYLAVLVIAFWICLDLMYVLHRLLLWLSERKRGVGDSPCERPEHAESSWNH